MSNVEGVGRKGGYTQVKVRGKVKEEIEEWRGSSIAGIRLASHYAALLAAGAGTPPAGGVARSTPVFPVGFFTTLARALPHQVPRPRRKDLLAPVHRYLASRLFPKA